MNILPKKKWHVRTRENIARVRKDEAQAAEEEKERERKVLLAEQESRTAVLRQRARERYKDDAEEGTSSFVEKPTLKHVNLFEDLEDGNVASTKVNTEHEKEKKDEKEKYEKQIGYLTYLGQDTSELTGNVAWYEKPPSRGKQTEEPASKSKSFSDPLHDVRRYLNLKLKGRGSEKEILGGKRKREKSDSEGDSSKRHKRSHSKHKHKRCKRKVRRSSRSSEVPAKPKLDIEQLRAERLKREREEKVRADKLLAKLHGDPIAEEKVERNDRAPAIKQKYNSQFNPQLAKQNYASDERR